MGCDNCDPSKYYPGRIIKTDKDLNTCSECGNKIDHRFLPITSILVRWDSYFHSICETISSKSPCLSQKIGAILVYDHSIISTGYNGPARGIPHCGYKRLINDNIIRKLMPQSPDTIDYVESTCPRKVLGYASGTHMELCPAQHAEENCISNAARNGVSVLNSTLYINCIIPCKNCFSTLINAGINEIVVEEITPYDEFTQFLINNSDIKIRRFEL